MKRVLVTGAGGFIGRHAIPALLARGYEVHAVARRRREAAAGVEWHAADLLDARGAAAVVGRTRPSHLLHLAWYAEHGKFWTAPENARWVGATAALVEAFAAADGRRAVAAGSCAEYDWSGDGVCDEDSTPLRPATLYGRCKNQAREQFEAACRATGLSGAWCRAFHLYGPHEAPGRFVAYVAIQLLRGGVAACSPGTQIRDLLHVADAGEAFAALLDATLTGPVNLGSGERVALADVARTLARHAGGGGRLELGARPAPPGDPPVLVPATRRLFAGTGWRPRYDLARGLADTVAWWRRQEKFPGSETA